MTVRYVGPGGSDAANGLSWANRKLTLNGVEDTPVVAGDTVYVGPGTYREQLTVDVSGTAGNPISYIGDYTGVNTDGVGGVVRITGSDNDQVGTRVSCISTTSKNYRTFTELYFDMCVATGAYIAGTDCTDWTISQCAFGIGTVKGVDCAGASQLRWTITDCDFAVMSANTGHGVYFNHSASAPDCAHLVQNCVFMGGYIGVYVNQVGGTTVKNCTILGANLDGILANSLAAGQVITVNNSVIHGCGTGLRGTAAGMITEDYNNVYANATARTNVTAGAHSLAYAVPFGARWFFEAVHGGKMVTPFDMASYSQIINVAGTSPTSTDLRGTGTIGAQREWGALEYDPDLKTTAGAGGGGPLIGGRLVRG